MTRSGLYFDLSVASHDDESAEAHGLSHWQLTTTQTLGVRLVLAGRSQYV